MKRLRLLIPIVIIILIWNVLSERRERDPLLPEVKLVLLIVVDQFADYYVDRLTGAATTSPADHQGGFATLFQQGRLYRRVLHPHAKTATCPGHASIATGVTPSRHGIIDNWWYDRKEHEIRYCVDDSSYGRSPRLLRVRGFPDWLREHSPHSKVYSVSGKDRAAIMMGGQKPNGVYWYDKSSGNIVSSDYYTPRGVPWWVEKFNVKESARSYYGDIWEALNSPMAAMGYDFDFGDFPDTFPHAIGSPTTAPGKRFFESFYGTPFLDDLTVQFAISLIENTQLGRDSDADLLNLSLSSLDVVGHRYGSSSREVADVLARLDISLKKLLDAIEEKVGLEHTLVVFTADHGIPPFPEAHHYEREDAHHQEHSREPRRVTTDDIACIQRVSEEFGNQDLFAAPLVLSTEAERHTVQEGGSLHSEIVTALSECAPVQSVFTRAEILRHSPHNREEGILNAVRRGFDPERSADFVLIPKPHYSLIPTRGINHGSPHRYDAEVPLVFLHPSLRSDDATDEHPKHLPVWITDIAPTLAHLIGIPAPKQLDGRSLFTERWWTEDHGHS
jgi:hypothetical protein